MSKSADFLPFKEYSSTLSRYSDSDQLQANQYKSIIESESGQRIYQREFPTIGAAAEIPLNANLPKFNKKYSIKVDDKNIDVFKTFWNYKQNGGGIFTDWKSAGVAGVLEDLSVSELPLYGKINDPDLVLSNTNNVRNNLTNYGKEYLTTTNMLNAESFYNGVSYDNSTSPFRSGLFYESDLTLHGNFSNKEDGDLVSRQVNQLRVNNPPQYVKNISSWQYINTACFIPNPNLKVFHHKLKFGIFDLDSLKLIGSSCLTENFGIIPKGLNKPADVYNDTSDDTSDYPPVSNIHYYNRGSRYSFNSETEPNMSEKSPSGTNLYCSANTNYVVMPKNHLYPNLDTSFQVSTGSNSLTLGVVMSPKLKNIQMFTLIYIKNI